MDKEIRSREENQKVYLNKLVEQTVQIGNSVKTIVDKLVLDYGKNEFLDTMVKLIKLGNDYLNYLEVNKDEFGDNDQVLRKIVTMAKSAFTMNIKLYVDSIKQISDYVNNHQDLYNLNPPANQNGPWSGLKTALYYSKNNDSRELFREGLIAMMNNKDGENLISLGDLDHLERFLVDSSNRPPNEFIPEYFNDHREQILAWAPLSLEEFQQYLIKQSGQMDEPTLNEWLLRLDAELASIKPNDIKSKYLDREKKLRLIRDLRFKRASLDELSKIVSQKINEITDGANLINLKKKFGPILKGDLKTLLDSLSRSVGNESNERISQVENDLRNSSIANEVVEEVLSYLHDVM